MPSCLALNRRRSEAGKCETAPGRPMGPLEGGGAVKLPPSLSPPFPFPRKSTSFFCDLPHPLFRCPSLSFSLSTTSSLSDEEEDRVCGLHFGRHINFESRPSLPSPIVRALSVRESISYSERFSIAWHEFCGSGGIHATSVRWADVHLSFPLPASLVSSAHCGGPAFSVHSSISSSSLCLSLSLSIRGNGGK